MAGAAVVQACIDGRKQPQGGPVKVRPTAGHNRDKAVMDEGRIIHSGDMAALARNHGLQHRLLGWGVAEGV